MDLLGDGVAPGKYGKPRVPTPGSTLRKEADAIGRLVREKWAPGVAGSMEAA